MVNVTEIDEVITFKVITPTRLILSIPSGYMPRGWQTWTTDPQDIAKTACNRLGLPVTVEVKKTCTARPTDA